MREISVKAIRKKHATLWPGPEPDHQLEVPVVEDLAQECPELEVGGQALNGIQGHALVQQMLLLVVVRCTDYTI